MLSKTGDIYLQTLNPLLYRGYVYDQETGLYYLQSRYYNPKVGRFINADGQMSDVGGDILGYNMFAYCMNNPVNMSDPDGNWPRWIEKLIKAIESIATRGQTKYGAARKYTPTQSTNQNCLGHALGEKEFKYVGGSPDAVKNYSVENVAEMLLDDFKGSERNIRRIDSHDSPIGNNEYRIALRTSSHGDYHFMVQHNDGSWSHKPGVCSSRLIKGTNPSIVTWDIPVLEQIPLAFGDVIEIGSVVNYYHSQTVYFAVSN